MSICRFSLWWKISRIWNKLNLLEKSGSPYFFFNHFHGELVERNFAAFAKLQRGPECRIVFLERFKDWRGFVLEERFDFFVGKISFEECLWNPVIAGGVHANVGGKCLHFAVWRLRGRAATESQLVAAARAGEVSVDKFKIRATVFAEL